MRIHHWPICILSLIVTSFAFGDIKQVHSMAEVESYFNQFQGGELLGAFDIYDTLLLPSDPAFQTPNFKYHNEMINRVLQLLTPEESSLFKSVLGVSGPQVLVEESTVVTLQRLQKKNIKMIALTETLTGPIEGINMVEYTHAELKKLGINLSSTFPTVVNFNFTQFQANRGAFPVYNRGILFTNGEKTKANANYHSRGDLLVQFFKQQNWTPEMIIVVDDNIENLKEIEKAIAAFNPQTKYLGLHYLAVHQFPAAPVDRKTMEQKWNALALKAKQLAQKKGCGCGSNR